MASSSVQYYEKQKELQDTITQCEQKRLDLEKQLRMSLQTGQTTSKMKAARLHSYWKKICEDEKKAKLRNEAVMREFERIDAHLHEMNARTQRLAIMKKQYEDYICRTYPQWNELMNGPPQRIQPENHEQAEHPVMKSAVQVSDATRQKETVVRQDPAKSIPSSHSPITQAVAATPMQSLPSRQHQFEDETHKKMLYSEDTVPESEIYQNLPGSSRSSQHLDDVATQIKANVTSHPVQKQEVHTKPEQVLHSTNSINSMRPPPEEEKDEDSDFGTDSEIPMAHSVKTTIVKAQSEEIEKDRVKARGPIKPELTIDGLLNLLRLVENDIADAFSLEGYYRSSWPETSVKNDIIRQANSSQALGPVDMNLISMVVLEQITLIIRSLSEKCLIPVSILQGDNSTITPQRLSQHLSPEAQIVWKALFAHFSKLVETQVMKSNELSAIFTPCLVAENTSQDKAHTFLVQLLENVENPNVEKANLQNTGKSLSPAGTMEGSGSFVEDGKVPRLKFGSLLEKPMSDDDSSFINSLPRDAMPLNETAAYKTMISTGRSDPPTRRQSSTQDDTDDDVEKQIASALSKPAAVHQSPRKKVEVDDPSETSSQTLQTTSHIYVPTAMETKSPRQPVSAQKPKFQGVRISSDLDTDTEVDAGIFGSSRQADNLDFDFYD